ncbi:MAG: hexokinase family protein [Cellulosilyticaceae bacterium]
MANSAVQKFLSQKGMYFGDFDFQVECQKYIEEMTKGLQGEESSLEMIPTYIGVGEEIQTNKPTVVIDAGGTNFRVGLVNFDTCKNPEISDFSKTQMPGIAKELSKEEFFGTLVDYTKDVAAKGNDIGFCFSYPTEITKQKDGVLTKWTKEVKAPEVVGELIGANLVEGLKKNDNRDRKVVILNDTVATLLGGKGITANRAFDGYIGFIFGTGTNLCYIEQNAHITKVADLDPSKNMIINTESGAYNKLPQGEIDRAFDATTNNPGDYVLEKMSSGRYLGPVVLGVLQAAAKDGLFSAECSKQLQLATDMALIDVNNFAYDSYDASNILVQMCQTEEDRIVMYELVDAMIERAAKICAIKLAATILKTESGKNPCKPIGVVCEGTTFFKLKNYKTKLEYYMKHELTDKHGRYFEIIKGEDLNLIGTAIAALSND